MTAQALETIIFEGEETFIAEQPLKEYLNTRQDVKFAKQSTACHRGYIGSWKITNNKLFLIGLEAEILSDKEGGYRQGVNMNYLFPDLKEVHAEWFTGQIKIHKGKVLLEAPDGSFPIESEEEIILHFLKGVLISREVVDNRETYSDFMKRMIERVKHLKLE